MASKRGKGECWRNDLFLWGIHFIRAITKRFWALDGHNDASKESYKLQRIEVLFYFSVFFFLFSLYFVSYVVLV